MTFCVSVQFKQIHEEVITTNYLMAWEVYRLLCRIYPSDACIDIYDNSNGEVIQCNQEDAD